MISKTQISRRTLKKTNSILVDTINVAKKNDLLEISKKLSGPRRHLKKINLSELERENDKKIMVVGKVLGNGEFGKKISISALSYSSQAMEKLKKAGCEVKTIKEEIEKNPKLEGVKIL